jgi:hypothetical protein
MKAIRACERLLRGEQFRELNVAEGSSSAVQLFATKGSGASSSGRSSQHRPLWIAWPPLVAAPSAVKDGHLLTFANVRSAAGS